MSLVGKYRWIAEKVIPLIKPRFVYSIQPHKFENQLSMKKLNFVIALFIAGSFFSCKDEEASPVIDTEEVADLVGSSLASNSSGLAAVAEDLAGGASDGVENAGGRTQVCGVEEMQSYERTNPSGSTVKYDYSLVYTYLLTCSNLGIPQSFKAGLTYSGSFESTRVSSENGGSADLTVGTLEDSKTTFEINGTFKRDGTFNSKVRNKTASSSTIQLTVAKMTVDKTTEQITGGTATVEITGSVSGKGNFNQTASVTFLGNKQGEITINGTTYSVNLTTGEIAQK